MAYVQMRNKLTGEFKDVEPDSDEFYELRAEVAPGGQSVWEQSNVAHRDAVQERAEQDGLLEEDLGHEHQGALMHQALVLDASGVAPEANPHLQLTPGEIEGGLTPQQKLQDLRDQYDEEALTARQGIFRDAAENIAPDGVKGQPDQQTAQGQLARAGGSDERDNVPRPDASQQGGSGSSSGSKASSSSGSSASGSSAGGSSGAAGAAGSSGGGGQ